MGGSGWSRAYGPWKDWQEAHWPARWVVSVHTCLPCRKLATPPPAPHPQARTSSFSFSGKSLTSTNTVPLFPRDRRKERSASSNIRAGSSNMRATRRGLAGLDMCWEGRAAPSAWACKCSIQHLVPVSALTLAHVGDVKPALGLVTLHLHKG